MTPKKLAQELDLDPKALRVVLRVVCPKSNPKGRWYLTDEEVAS
jgi:hypothetical protein